jgi:pilus assembly protein CpaE
LSSIGTISADWRFARIQIETPGKKLENALAYYEDHNSPDIIIIQTDRTDEVLEKGLEHLSQYCEEGTAAIIIGPVNDVKLYRNLMAMGISDYLVAPVPTEDLIGAIGHIIQELKGTLGSQLVSIIGTKGGVGTSTLSQIIALALSENLKQKTLLMDAAAGHSSLWSQFGFKPSRTIIEAARAAVNRDMEELSQMLVIANDYLSILNSGAERLLDNPIALQAYNMLLDKMLYQFPYVVIDLSYAPELIQREILSRSEKIFMVSTPTLTSLSITRSLKKEIEDLRGGEKAPITLVTNMRGQEKGAEVSEKDISETINLNPNDIYNMGYDPKFFLGLESEGQKIENTKSGQKLINDLAQMLASDLHIGHGSSTKQSKESSNASGMAGLLGYLKGK